MEDFFAEKGIELIAGRVVLLDRDGSRAVLEDGSVHGYDHLVLAMGSSNRTLPVPGSDLDGVFTLRAKDDADVLRAALKRAENVVVAGGPRGSRAAIRVASGERARSQDGSSVNLRLTNGWPST